MLIKSLVAAALLASVTAAPAVAQQRTLSVQAGAAWTHVQTGVTLPATLIGIPRDAVTDNSAKEIDVAAAYGNGAATTVTLYVFRPALTSVPVWFDRSETQILLRDIYANPTAPAPVAAFAPPRSAAASGLRRIYVPGRGPYKSTGLAMMPLGDWLVVVRISSQQLDAAALDAKLSEVIAALGWPDRVADTLAAAPVAPCATPLAYAKNAKLKAPDMTDALLGATLATIQPDPKEVAKATPVTWCREGEATSQYGVYRANGDATGYSIAMGDAGAAISVWPALDLGKGKPGYQLSLGLLDRTLIFPSFDKLPAPAAAVSAVTSNNPISSTERGSKNIVITTGK
ncbi:MAG: hypothetical protein E7773_02360 [Sphingomonas sp.]|uniref:hypothetical protein n=1 Tax=Sphingomonas sp. TaxID=28214 RepID=UPI001202BCC6|nr:hypothetical protein [Sphingomonas sp.]THD37842.1 MAG: hypothetical protein E7773_02360 [Sphingomonas sp.]